ncbi:MAG: Transcriptional regulator, ArsR family [Polyangiaceae bacterium]|jgi:DNA-binding transcriptional ArsR family regulator|nr:Transcriptional regulator, ArsR family [Polyangiaceae bacterium]
MSRAPSVSVRRAAEAALVFAALGDETRLQLLSRLCHEGPLSITRLSEGASISRQAVTKHLVTLKSSGLLEAKRQGRERVYQFAPARLQAARRYLDQVSTQWDDAIDRLRAHVEET